MAVWDRADMGACSCLPDFNRVDFLQVIAKLAEETNPLSQSGVAGDCCILKIPYEVSQDSGMPAIFQAP